MSKSILALRDRRFLAQECLDRQIGQQSADQLPWFYIAKQLTAINQQAVQEYSPIAEQIVRSGSLDTHHIEQTLDGLLGFCSHGAALVLYKKLCRHYWHLNPEATASYINAYREMWDSEDEVETECELGVAKAGDA